MSGFRQKPGRPGERPGPTRSGSCRGPGARWAHFRHVADIGVRGFGASLGEAFEQAALALTAVVTDPGSVQPLQALDIACQAPDAEILLVDWLNELVFAMATRGMLFAHFEVRVWREDDGYRLAARALGEPVDVPRHQPAAEVKGATLSALEVAEAPGEGWRVQCIVDV